MGLNGNGDCAILVTKYFGGAVYQISVTRYATRLVNNIKWTSLSSRQNQFEAI